MVCLTRFEIKDKAFIVSNKNNKLFMDIGQKYLYHRIMRSILQGFSNEYIMRRGYVLYIIHEVIIF